MIKWKCKALLTYTFIALGIGFQLPAQSSNIVNPKSVVSKGASLIKQQKFKEATHLFYRAAKCRPKNSVLQFYLGMSYLYSRNTLAAEMALSKAIALSNPGTTMNKQATDLIYKYRRIRPYSCLQQYHRRNLVQ